MSHKTISNKNMKEYDEKIKTEIKDARRCPTCSGYAVRTCNCDQRDSKCVNGHNWYIINGVIVVGVAIH